MVFIITWFALIALIDLLPLVQRRDKSTIVLFLILFILALTISILQALDVGVPSSMLSLGNFYKELGLSYPH